MKSWKRLEVRDLLLAFGSYPSKATAIWAVVLTVHLLCFEIIMFLGNHRFIVRNFIFISGLFVLLAVSAFQRVLQFSDLLAWCRLPKSRPFKIFAERSFLSCRRGVEGIFIFILVP